jgi:thioredoxin 1
MAKRAEAAADGEPSRFTPDIGRSFLATSAGWQSVLHSPVANLNSEDTGGMMATIIEVSDATFENEVLQSEQPVLVDFWASWCGPCRAISPIVEDVAASYEGKLKVMKMNVDQNTQTPARYGIRGIPALLVFKNGRIADQIVGCVPKATIDQSVIKVLV